VLPPSLQDSLPADWLAFAGTASNPLDRCKRFQIIHPPFLDLTWRKGSFMAFPPRSAEQRIGRCLYSSTQGLLRCGISTRSMSRMGSKAGGDDRVDHCPLDRSSPEADAARSPPRAHLVPRNEPNLGYEVRGAHSRGARQWGVVFFQSSIPRHCRSCRRGRSRSAGTRSPARRARTCSSPRPGRQ
jgi:hypothetical protein